MTLREFIRDTNYSINRKLTPAVKWVFFANILVWIVENIAFAPFGLDDWFLWLFAQNPTVSYRLITAGQYALRVNWLCPLQFFSYMFVQLNFWHLFWNMLALWFFGPPIEARLGTPAFLKFYFFTGFCAGALHGMLAPFFYGENYFMIGASGAIFGVLLAFAIFYPHQQVFLWFILPIPSRLFVLLIGVFTFASLFQSGGSGISHLTHLAGLGFGYLWIWLRGIFSGAWLFNSDPRPFARRYGRRGGDRDPFA